MVLFPEVYVPFLAKILLSLFQVRRRLTARFPFGIYLSIIAVGHAQNKKMFTAECAAARRSEVVCCDYGSLFDAVNLIREIFGVFGGAEKRRQSLRPPRNRQMSLTLQLMAVHYQCHDTCSPNAIPHIINILKWTKHFHKVG